jgi:plasmid stabilization system protein ParE
VPKKVCLVYLTPQAKTDLEIAWLSNLKGWLDDRAHRPWAISIADGYVKDLVEQFYLIPKSPFLPEKRHEFKEPVCLYRYQSHVIVYKLLGKKLHVIRVLHMRQNWVPLFAGGEVRDIYDPR